MTRGNAALHRRSPPTRFSFHCLPVLAAHLRSIRRSVVRLGVDRRSASAGRRELPLQNYGLGQYQNHESHRLRGALARLRACSARRALATNVAMKSRRLVIPRRVQVMHLNSRLLGNSCCPRELAIESSYARQDSHRPRIQAPAQIPIELSIQTSNTQGRIQRRPRVMQR